MSSAPYEIGTLIAVILKAKNLPNKRHIGKQDPYCSLGLNKEIRRTRAIKRGGQHPEWDEEVRFSLLEDGDDEDDRTPDGEDGPPPPPPKGDKSRKIQGGTSMKLQCFADDPREPDLIGETMVDLTEVLTKGETDEWFTLMNKDKYCGEVYLELTFWSNERPPEKKSKPKITKANKQYAGPGLFTPSGDSPSSSLPSSLLTGGGSKSSRISSNSSQIDGDHTDPLVASLSSRLSISSSRLPDLYSAPYEQKSRYSPDTIANDFGELHVSDHRRRESFPPRQGHTPRPTSSSFSTMPTHPSHGFEPSAYSDGGSQYGYDRPVTPTQQSHHRATISGGPNPYIGQAPYQPRYETITPPSGYPPPQVPMRHSSGPRYSLPAASSGFMPIPSQASSGFMPIGSHPHESSGFAPPPQTPTPMNYSASQIPTQSGFVHMPMQTPAPSGYMTPMPPSPPSGFLQSAQYPLQQQSSFQYPQYVPQPPASAPPQQYAPPPPQSAPPQQQYLPPPTPTSIPPHSHSAPPPQQYQGYIQGTPSPPHEYAPPPPPLQDNSLSSSQGAGSRPLPQPQAYGHPPPRHQSSLPLPPGPQSYSPSQQGNIAFPIANGYSSVPPPPPPPLQIQHERTTSQSYHPPTDPAPPPPPPPPLSLHSSSPSGRPSLPQPPVSYHQQQQQQPIYQPVPPPPPPPPPPIDFAQHLQPPPPPPPLHTNTDHSYYPGPPQTQWMSSQGQPNGQYPLAQSQSG